MLQGCQEPSYFKRKDISSLFTIMTREVSLQCTFLFKKISFHYKEILEKRRKEVNGLLIPHRILTKAKKPPLNFPSSVLLTTFVRNK